MTIFAEEHAADAGSDSPHCLVPTRPRKRDPICLFILAFALVYVICFCVALPSYIDEAYTFNIATDRSLAHMLSALRNGADGSLPVYGILVFVWEKIFGSSEMSLRLTGGVFVVVLVWHMYKRLAQRFAPGNVALAILLVLGNKQFIYYAIQARFYGLLLFAFSLAFWSTWDLIESKAVSRKRLLLHALICGLLWLSHPLGMVYGSILGLLYVSFSLLRKTFSLLNAIAFIGGPVFFSFWLPSFLVQRTVNPVYPPWVHLPGWHKYWEYAFLGSPVFCGISLTGIVLFLVWTRRYPNPVNLGASLQMPVSPNRSHRHLVSYSLAFIFLLNATIALVDAAGVIHVYLLLAIRYVLVATIAYGVIFCAILQKLDEILRRFTPRWTVTLKRAQQAFIAILVLLSMDLMWSKWLLHKSSRESYYRRVAELAQEKHLDIYCEDHLDAFLLTTRTSATKVTYLLEDNFPFRTLMLQVQKYYPHPIPLGPVEFRHSTNDVVLASFTGEALIVNPQAPATP